MDYFWIHQDKRYTDPPFIQGFSPCFLRRDFTPENASKVEVNNVVFAPSQKKQNFIDLVDIQLFLVSDKVKKVFSMYDKYLPWKQFCILNNVRNDSCNYFVPILQEIPCVSEKSKLNMDKSCINKLILKKDRIQDHPFFRAGKLNTEAVVIRLDVAESLLRRRVEGIIFERVGVE